MIFTVIIMDPIKIHLPVGLIAQLARPTPALQRLGFKSHSVALITATIIYTKIVSIQSVNTWISCIHHILYTIQSSKLSSLVSRLLVTFTCKKRLPGIQFWGWASSRWGVIFVDSQSQPPLFLCIKMGPAQISHDKGIGEERHVF